MSLPPNLVFLTTVRVQGCSNQSPYQQFVDTFTTMLPRRAQNVLDGAWDIVYGAIALVLAWRMALGAQDQFIAKTTLMIRPWPTWGAVAACAALMAALGVVSLAVGFRMIGRKS